METNANQIIFPNRIQEELLASQKQSKEYRDELDKTVAEKQKKQLELLAELDDLTQTKQNLEERLIELIKYVLFYHWTFQMQNNWNVVLFKTTEDNNLQFIWNVCSINSSFLLYHTFFYSA